MKIGKIYYILQILIILLFTTAPDETRAQEARKKPSRQAAMDAFSKGDYERAYNEFVILLDNFSKDPLYRYYAGVSLVRMNRDPEQAQIHLQDALNGSLDIKNVPDDAWFYLGRSQQLAGRFAEAIEAYRVFESKAGKKKARDMEVPEYIRECNEGRGKLREPLGMQGGIAAAERKVTPDPALKPVPVKEDAPEEVDKVLTQAMNYQVKADSLDALAAKSKSEIGNIPAGQQKTEKEKAAGMQARSAEYQKLADAKLAGAAADNTADRAAATVPPEPAVRQTGVFSVFSIETDPVRSKNIRISFDPELPSGLIYRIQLGVFSKTPDISFFKGLSPVAGFSIAGSSAKRYFAGMFRRMSDAAASLNRVKQMGFRDAFVTAVMDGKAVSAERAALLEKEWGTRPLVTVVEAQKPGGQEAATLVFRVELLRSPVPPGDSETESYRKVAGNRGFEIIEKEDGTFVYLIGKFITFESASEYAGLLNRNGFREAKVTAYAGSTEIPVETAKQLFEKQK